MPSVHEAAQVGFDVAAEAYERGRPGFPPEAVARLVAELGIHPGTTVVDLAAGTGKLTRMLVPSGAGLLAIEPVDGMRRVFARMVPGVPIMGGLAEAIPVRDGSIDAVTVAQAFHWFDAPAALGELHRVLRPGGRLGLMWNVRDESAPLSRMMTELFDRHREGAPAFRDQAWRPAFEATELFTPLEAASFRHEQRLSVDGFLDRAVSVSFIAALPPEGLADVREELLGLLPRGVEEIGLPYRCEISWCERR